MNYHEFYNYGFQGSHFLGLIFIKLILVFYLFIFKNLDSFYEFNHDFFLDIDNLLFSDYFVLIKFWIITFYKFQNLFIFIYFCLIHFFKKFFQLIIFLTPFDFISVVSIYFYSVPFLKMIIFFEF